jgi:hypothetical protein
MGGGLGGGPPPLNKKVYPFPKTGKGHWIRDISWEGCEDFYFVKISVSKMYLEPP